MAQGNKRASKAGIAAGPVVEPGPRRGPSEPKIVGSNPTGPAKPQLEIPAESVLNSPEKFQNTMFRFLGRSQFEFHFNTHESSAASLLALQAEPAHPSREVLDLGLMSS